MDLTVTWGTNDTPVVQNAIDNAEPGDMIVFPPGVYCIRELCLRSGISIVSLEGSAKHIKVMEILDSCITDAKLHRAILTQIIRDNSTLFIALKPLKNVTVQGLIFDGNIDNDEKNITSQLLELSNIPDHSGIRFLNCEIRNFGKGIYVHGTRDLESYSGFEIKNCVFTKNVYSIYFHDTNTTDIKIKDCKFIDCVESITIVNIIHKYNTCDQVLIEGCHFSGKFHGYPIHFGSNLLGKAATHVTVKGCVVVGPDSWYCGRDDKVGQLCHDMDNGSADHIALYDVEHFNVHIDEWW